MMINNLIEIIFGFEVNEDKLDNAMVNIIIFKELLISCFKIFHIIFEN